MAMLRVRSHFLTQRRREAVDAFLDTLPVGALTVPFNRSQITHQQLQSRIRREATRLELHLQIVVDTRT